MSEIDEDASQFIPYVWEGGTIEEVAKDIDDQTKVACVKQLFSQLDPAVVKAQGDAMGEVGVAVKYKPEKEVLLIRVIAAQGLFSRQVARHSVDPCVEVSLPDSLEEEVKRTTVKKSTKNPVWNEILVLPVEEASLWDSKLLIRVLDCDDVIGEVVIELDEDVLLGKPEWFDLEDQKDWSVSGAVHVRVKYTTPTTLHVNVASAEGLCGKNKNNLSDPFVRVTLAGKYPVKSTKVVKGTVNPIWSEIFDFSIPVQLLQTITVLFAVYHKNVIGKDEFLGEARISLSEFRHFHSIDSWFPLADLKHVARHRSEWSKGAVEQELREALVAHVSARSPQLIFNNTSRDRVIKLTCRKVGQSSRIRMKDGNISVD